MVELRKRKETPAEASEGVEPKQKKGKPTKQENNKIDNGADASPDTAASGSHAPKQGDYMKLDGFGGEFQLTDNATTTLKELIDKSDGGVVIFTYPKANTPGCTKQACLFRDSYQALTRFGFAIYGLSRDSVKSNSSFISKNKLPYQLICDTNGTLIKALGFHKPPKTVYRGVFVIDKDGKVLASMRGGPDATVEAVHPLVEAAQGGKSTVNDESAVKAIKDGVKEAKEQNETADKQKVADTIAGVASGVNASADQVD